MLISINNRLTKKKISPKAQSTNSIIIFIGLNQFILHSESKSAPTILFTEIYAYLVIYPFKNML